MCRGIGWMRTSYQGCVRAVRRKLKAIKPDIVHGQGTERECAISAVFSKFPNVLTIHGNMRLIAEVNQAKPFSFFWLAAQLEKVTLPRTRGVVCITRYTQDAVKDLAKRTWVVPNAVDEAFFDINSEPAGVPHHPLRGPGLLSQKPERVHQSLDPLAAEGKFKVVFLGGISKEDAVRGRVPGIGGAAAVVRIRGLRRPRNSPQAFQTAALLALPSLEDNCPMVVLEAMAAGVPVLAAKVGGLPDLIEDGKNGLFCDPLDAASMKSGVSRILDDRQTGAGTGRYGESAARRSAFIRWSLPGNTWKFIAKF